MSSECEKLLNRLRDSGNILIVSHENPDADAIGSTLALGLALEQADKNVTMYNRDGVPENLEFLPGSGKITKSLEKTESPYDMAIAVDCAGMDRAGDEFLRFVETGCANTIAIIDHHRTNNSEVDVCYIDEHASSTGVMIYGLIKSLSLGLTEDIAINLYATIIGDTGSFRYSNTNDDTFKVAADLVRAGANPAVISEALYENEPLRKLKLLGLVLPSLHIEDGSIASVTVDKEMFRRTDTMRSDTEGMVNFPRCIKGVEVAVLFREEGNEDKPRWKVSLRSKGRYDVSAVAEYFGGGGHRNASGCSVEGGIDEVRKLVYQKIKEGMN